ncbi:MAG: protein translocase subunit SecD, partial [Alphaproteobacteria bacterium GM202ARS2]|nr:protein translocase subunit SecD [Alphaproteobacteria bacterium GM202ARS2]
MHRFHIGTISAIIAVCLISAVLTLPNLFSRSTLDSLPSWIPTQQIALGLDLQGGAHILLEVDLDAVIDERLEAALDDARRALRQDRIGYRGLNVSRDQVITFRLTEPEKRQAALDVLSNAANQVVTIDTATGQGQIAFTEAALAEFRQAATAQSLEIVRRRIDEHGTREPTIQQQGADRIVVQVPGEQNPDAVKSLLGKTAKLNFHMVDANTTVTDAIAGRLPAGSVLLPFQEEGLPGEHQIVVRKRADVGGDLLTDAQTGFGQSNEPIINFTFDRAGARKFGEITRDNVGERLAIVLDGVVISSPVINEPILGGSGMISGNFTVPEANELAKLLRAGALPAPLEIVEERTVGPDLGADSIEAGKIAALVAITA